MNPRIPIWGIVLAAGRGSRFGREKHTLEIGDVPIWRMGRRALIEGGVDEVIVVGDVDGAVPGGDRRRDSVAAGLAGITETDGFVLVHDSARPLVSPDLVRRVIDRLRLGDVDGVVPAVAVRDTVKRVSGERVLGTVDRNDLVAVQTPQGFDLRTLRSAHEACALDATDDASMVESIGGSIVVVEGDPANVKITYPDDLTVVEALRSRPDVRTASVKVGWGFDAHRFGGPGPVRLAGIEVDGARGIVATSDGDVVAHAVADALLGSLALGDLGVHFPSSDPGMRDVDSMELLSSVVGKIEDRGHLIDNVDVTVIAQSVRIGPHRDEMRDRLASTLGIDPSVVSVKATSTDAMGSIGADEGIAVAAVVTIYG